MMLFNWKRSELPSGDDENLDMAFYRWFYPDLRDLNDRQVQQHWLLHGRAERRFPNSQTISSLLPDEFSASAYIANNRDLQLVERGAAAAVAHFLNNGRSEGRRFKSVHRDNDFVAAYQRHDNMSRRDKGVQDEQRFAGWSFQNLNDYLFVHGFTSSEFVSRFDDQFYALLTGLPTASGRYGMLFHFVEAGCQQLLPIASDLHFDADFYRRLSTTHGDLTDVELYRRWLSGGDFEHNPPNHAYRMRVRFGIFCKAEDVLDVDAYRHSNADLTAFDDEELIEHVFNDGLFEGRSSIRMSCSNVKVLTRFADQLAIRGRSQAAEDLYLKLAHHVPDDSRLNQRIGDHFFRQGRHASAVRYFRRSIASQRPTKWAFLNGASSCAELNDLAGALAMMDAAVKEFPEDQYLLGQRAAFAERFFSDEFGYARGQALGGDIEQAQSRLTNAARACDFPQGSAPPTKPIRSVALFANMDLFQCTIYRVEQKAEQLVAAGFSVDVYAWNRDEDLFLANLAKPQAVIFYRVAAFPRTTEVINKAREAGLVTFYDVDDLVFDPDEFPEPLADYAGQISTADYVDICLGVPLFREAISACDYAIASTPLLAAQMSPLVRRQRAFVHRNGLGFRHMSAVRAQESAAGEQKARRKSVRIFYGSGTKAHKLDFETILLPAMKAINRRYGARVEFVMVGHRPIVPGDDFLGRIRFEPFTSNIEEFWALLANADISLSVLRRGPVTSAKSEIKWLEAAMFGVPSVVSATETFEEVIEDGVDGFLAFDSEAFVTKMAALIDNPDLRHQMGAAAKAKAMNAYGVEAMAAHLGQILRSVEMPQSARARILVVNVFYAPNAKGGATRVMIDNIRDVRAIDPDGFEFEVFATLEGGVEPYSVHVSSFEDVRTTSVVAGTEPDVDFAPRNERMASRFRDCVERFRPDLIHFHCIQRLSASVTEVARELGIPYVITLHDGWWISDQQFLYNKNGAAPLYDFDQPYRYRNSTPKGHFDRPNALRPSLTGAKALLAVSDKFADVYRGTGLTNVRSLPNGLTHGAIKLASNRGARECHGGKVRIAHIGGLEVHKGFPLLKAAVFAAKPTNISVLAIDLALETGEEVIEDWGGTPVRMIARRRQNDVQALYDEIDVLFAPSLWPESFGLVSREAIAAGCWVVTSDRGAIGDPVVEGVNGHKVSVNDLSGLKNIIRRIDDHPEVYTSRPSVTEGMRTSYDQARDLIEIYRDILGLREEKPDDAATHAAHDPGTNFGNAS